MKPSFLAGLALALPIAAKPTPADHVYEVAERAITVTDENVDDFKYFAQHCAATHCNSDVDAGTVISCSSDACPDVTANGATVSATFAGTLTDIQGYIAVDDTREQVIVAWKGSVSIRNWITDFIFIQTDCSDLTLGCLAHAGFQTAWDETSSEVMAAIDEATSANPTYELVFTGHSLGAAVATLAAAHARQEGYSMDLYIFGSPRVGNEAFVNLVTEQEGAEYRVTHLDDPFARLPPIFTNYRHTSPEYWFHTGTSTTLNYTAADALVCEGYANIDCNAGSTTINFDSHNFYFVDMTACDPGETEWKKKAKRGVEATTAQVSNKRDDDDLDVQPDMGTTLPKNVTDEELYAKLADWANQDIELAGTL